MSNEIGGNHRSRSVWGYRIYMFIIIPLNYNDLQIMLYLKVKDSLVIIDRYA